MTTEETTHERADTARRNWGRWGDDDERGTLNLVTADGVLDAAHRLRTGKVYSLALPIQRRGVPIYEGYRGAPRRFSLSNRGDEGRWADAGWPDGLGCNEDMLMLASHSITHMDALSHVFADDVMYNGYPSSSFETFGGAAVCDVTKTGTIAARGVLLDLATHQGVDWLAPGHAITSPELQECATAQGTEVRAGDVVLVRTGWLDQFAAGQAAIHDPQPGLGTDALQFVDEHDVAAIGADNSAIECMPFDGGHMELHVALIVHRGVTLLEHLYLAELAADRCHEFLLCVGALPVTGAAGSPINPVAIG
jgi:kynurenine formamidase